MSLVESLANVLVGIGISFVSQIIIFAHYGVHLSVHKNIAMTLWFTAISIARSYCLRRFFNARRARASLPARGAS